MLSREEPGGGGGGYPRFKPCAMALVVSFSVIKKKMLMWMPTISVKDHMLQAIMNVSMFLTTLNFIVSVSGISGSTAAAQSQVSVGMGLLAGSTVMLITVIWGTCCIVGKCDIQNSVAVDMKDTNGFSLTGLHLNS